MRFRVLVLVGASLLATTVLSGSVGASSGRFGMENRFAPSGVVRVDPFAGATPALAAPANVVAPAPSGTSGCSDAGANVRANQECTNQSATAFLGRGQSQNETAVAVNPRDPKNVLVAQNDYRRGDAGCGADFTLDGGRHWGSELVPVGFTPGFTAQRHYWEASGDPAVGFDSRGEAYVLCEPFDRGSASDSGSNASAIVVFRSSDGGASWNFPGSVVAQATGTGSVGLLDKNYMAIDSNPQSRFRDRIYVAWDQFSPDFTSAPVTFAFSSDHGATWHRTGRILGFSRALCPVNFSGAPAGTCDANFAPQPFVAPNGDVYVVVANFDNCSGSIPGCPGEPGDNHNQILIAKSTDGGRSFGPPVKVADYNELPDCLTYTGFDAGSSCVPTAPLSPRSIFRAMNYASGVALSNDRIAVTFGSYINAHSGRRAGNCRPTGVSQDTFLNTYEGVGRVNGCNNDIVLSVSGDGGRTFTGTTRSVERLPTVNDEGRPLADQWFQWAAAAPGGRLVVSYYDRKYADDQRNGRMDVSLRRGSAAPVRVTDVHMPPTNEFPDVGTRFGTFMGDYAGLAVGSDGVAHPAWADTRNRIFAVPESGDVRRLVPAGFGADVYTSAVR